MKVKTFTITRLSDSSWFKINLDGMVIHFDPGFSGLFENQGIPEKELSQKADFLLITHAHKDHLQADMVEKLYQPETRIICSKPCLSELKHPATLMKAGDEITIDAFKVNATHAYNTEEGHSTHKFHHKGDYNGYILEYKGTRIYFAGDTDLIEEMAHLGKIDIAFLPISGTYVMDMEEAVQAVEVIKPGIVVAMHEHASDTGLFKTLVESKTSTKALILTVGQKARIT